MHPFQLTVNMKCFEIVKFNGLGYAADILTVNMKCFEMRELKIVVR